MPEVESNPGPPPEPEPKPAPRLGSYLLVQALGSGGMSNVFRAVHEESGSVVAVKVLPRTLAKNVTLLQRFMREAKSAESLDHPNVVAIYDRGFDQGRHYLVLEYVEGRDLHDRVRINGPLAADEAVNFIKEVAEGLRYAAGQGMIHRDVKPANLLMTPDGHAKIIDLGLALQIEDEDERVTRDGTTVGTVDYMAPEQARDSRQTSERSDIYSLGCTFYYLLTGSPPYPGGGLSDKLARHYKAPIPDPREHRPDVSEPLALLIRRMMEKKPENRYADYTKLIEALDALGDPPTQDVSGEHMDALFADDDDDEIGLAPTESAMSRRRDDRPPSTRDQLLMAEIVDDDDDDLPVQPPPKAKSKPTLPSSKSKSGPTLPAPGPRPGSRETPARREAAAPADLSMADLAALDAASPPVRRPKTGSSPSNPSIKSASNPSQQVHRAPVVAPIAAITEDDGEEVFGAEGTPRGGSELPLKTWIAAGAMVGIAIAVVAFGAMTIINVMKPEKPDEPIERSTEVASRRNDNDSETLTTAPPVIRIERPKGPTGPIRKNVPAVVKDVPKVEVAAPVVVVAPLLEKPYPPEWEAKLAPPAWSRPVAPVGSGEKPRIVVRRLIQAGNEPQTSSLAFALSRAGDLVEFADSGPFFEDDFQVAGKTRLIRAREGIRPMIKIDVAGNDIIKDQAAKFVLGGAKVDNLVLEGLDIAVDVRDLPERHSTLFLLQGADLTLRDCSLTILNANDTSRTNRFSIFRVEEAAKPNRIVLDRTTIRGPVRTLVEVASTRFEMVVDRSLILGDLAPLIALEPAEKAARSFSFYRSLLSGRGTILEFSGKSSPVVVRSLGTTFARMETSNGPPPGPALGLLSSRAAFPGEPPSVLDWSGEDNEFVGWPGWLTSGPEASARVAGLDAVRSTWAGSDTSSRESAAPWPTPNKPEEITPGEFTPLAPTRNATLAKIATPHPRLRDLTIGSIAPLATPELSAALTPGPMTSPNRMREVMGGGSNAQMPKSAPMPPPDPNATGPRRKGGATAKAGQAPTPPPPGPLNLTFNVQEAPWLGDLGLYLQEKLVPGTPQATVMVRGGGVHAMTPIRLLDGLSIAIIGDSAENTNLPMATFVAKPGSNGRSMIEIHGGDLAIANLNFSTEGSPRPRHWVYAEDSILAIRRCRFRDPLGNAYAGSARDVGSVIAFVAKGTAPIPSKSGPLVAATDRPTAKLRNCLIWTAADAISAEVGRGVVDLKNCLIISSGLAVSMSPADVARDKFEADLVLDHCTVAVDKATFQFGPLTGVPAGPARPWLILTRRCVFPRTQLGTPGSGSQGLIQVDPDAMARGALFWQSTADIYDPPHFLTSMGPQPSNLPSADLKRQWIDLWGRQHTQGDQGPNPRQNSSILRFKDKEKPKPGKVLPGALELDSSFKDLGVSFKELPGAPRPDNAKPDAGGKFGGGMSPAEL